VLVSVIFPCQSCVVKINNVSVKGDQFGSVFSRRGPHTALAAVFSPLPHRGRAFLFWTTNNKKAFLCSCQSRMSFPVLVKQYDFFLFLHIIIPFCPLADPSGKNLTSSTDRPTKRRKYGSGAHAVFFCRLASKLTEKGTNYFFSR
jgi:hypothetical protein